MISDHDTNFVYFSNLIKSRSDLNNFWKYLERTLKSIDIGYGFIQNTNDIWCRDYMPVQVAHEKFVQFRFYPSYCDDDKYRHLITDTGRVQLSNGNLPERSFSPLLLDGGNVVKAKNIVVLTERILKENDKAREDILVQLKQQLQVEHVHLIPEQPYDMTGHSDGIVRLLDDHILLVANYHTESDSWKAKYKRALERTGLKLIDFPGVTTNIKNSDGDYTALGCYINFAWLGDTILFPQFDLAEDKEALKEVKSIFREHRVIPVPAAELAMNGGVLNCVTWNVHL